MSREQVASPIGVAMYPKISKPDTFGPKADGKHKTDLALTAENAAKFKKQVEALAADEFGPKRKVIWRKNAEGANKHTLKQQEDGTYIFRSASKYQPAVFDAKNNKLNPEDVVIGGGSKIRLMLGVNFYDETKTTVTVSFYLNQVQVIELVEYKGGAGSGKSGFDEVDGGYEGEPASDEPSTDDASDDDNGSDFDKL